MKALFWKEWREHLRTTAFAFLLIALLMLRSGYSALRAAPTKSDFELGEWLMYLLLVLAPIFAVTLGWSQISGELKRDQWAFLIHRPITRTQIFVGKAIAGLSMYFFATVTPLLLLMLWLRVQTLVAIPFVPNDLREPLTTILAYAHFYFAGMLIAARPARWYGSRYLPLPAALAAIFLGGIWTENWQITLAQSVVFAVFALAAWGSFLTDGHYTRQPRLAKIGLGATLYTGLFAVMAFVVLITMFREIMVSVQASTRVTQKVTPAVTVTAGVKVAGAKEPDEKSEVNIRWVDAGDESVAAKKAIPPALKSGIWMESSTPWYLKPMPTLITPSIAAAGGLVYVQKDGKGMAQEEKNRRLKDLQNFLASTLAIGFICSIPTVLVARRARLSSLEIWAWWGGTLVLGLSGLLLLLALRKWPHLESCPNCKRKRTVHRELCEHCGAPFPSPAHDETSIFESSSSSAAPLQTNPI